MGALEFRIWGLCKCFLVSSVQEFLCGRAWGGCSLRAPGISDVFVNGVGIALSSLGNILHFYGYLKPIRNKNLNF